MGAWIEIKNIPIILMIIIVAPHMGAWIEMRKRLRKNRCRNVAPHMGAWIEIYPVAVVRFGGKGRTPHGCVD